MKRIFIGIDFSKLKFDVAVFEGATKEYLGRNVFENNLDGCQQTLAWIASITDVSHDGWLVCGEHTGLYSVALSHYVCASGVDMCHEPGLQIKLSKGMTRGKNDKIDAGYIAEYAYRFQDKVKPYRVASAALGGLKDLVAYRNRLLGYKKSLTISNKELQRVKADQAAVAFIYDDS
ncbi:MAG TPA: transposase [Williamwhitmania sp.]|nr:transposase [Williamwhitmania sp.]